MLEDPKPNNTVPKILIGLGLAVLVAGAGAWFAFPSVFRKAPAAAEIAAPEAVTDLVLSDSVPQNQWVEWTEGQTTPDFHVAGMDIRIDPLTDDGLNLARMTVTAPDGSKVDVSGAAKSGAAVARFAVVQMDAASEARQVLFTSFSYGAHCCVQGYLLEHGADGWRTVDLGMWDGDQMPLPVDIDGDGKKEFSLSDQRFLYAFDSYAGSYAPSAVYAVQDGDFVDVSANIKYRNVFRSELSGAKAACEQGGTGACAGYAGIAARLGQLDVAWPVVLNNYSRESDWTYPAPCIANHSQSCAEQEALPFETFPESLQWFLGANGYAAPSYVADARVNGPSFACAAARTKAEKMICEFNDLRKADLIMALAYTRAHALTSQRTALRAAQNDFLRERNSAPDAKAMLDMYIARINLLLEVG